MIDRDRINSEHEFPERLWKRPIELHDGKPHPRVAASSYSPGTPPQALRDDAVTMNPPNYPEAEQPENAFAEPQVKVSTEAGNARVTIDLPSADKKDLTIHCAENSLTVSVKTQAGSWTREIPLPFRVDPDTAKAVFKNRKLELIVRRHGSFNPPRPRIDWV
jgi:HSP20 family molecular chaperone IbpA